ncbi:MAG: YgiQ family radical SAM protein [Spirochaetales bacterium]|nr:YgiQ family radical SAM protein [Spirochaetales bacterium]
MIHFLPDRPHSVVDVMIVSGDVYLDHPSFGTSIISRVLHNAGYSVCIVSQPEYYDPDYISTLPDVRLFIGINAGNLDSIVANYTSNRTIRRDDAYSIDGKPTFDNGKLKRPDRATIFYTSYIKSRYKDVPIVLGGIEASLRRAVHYDYIQQKIRRSVLTDSKADLLIYSMGELAILDVAHAIENGTPLSDIRGTAYRTKTPPNGIYLPSFDDILTDRKQLIKLNNIMEDNMNPDMADVLIQEQSPGDYVVINPPQRLLTTAELDAVYELPYRRDYPDYCSRVPAWNMIKESVTAVRGCFGRCSFCAITLHQGAAVTSRSQASVIREVSQIARAKYFHKTITDVGGPTANMYGLTCRIGWCRSPHCLFPKLCPNLIINDDFLKLLKSIKTIDGVKNVFVSSGLRHDLCLHKPLETEYIIRNATSGHLKIAPEHVDDRILRLMRKPDNAAFEQFIALFERVKKQYNLKFYILPYIILSFPGSTPDSVKKLKSFLQRHHIQTYQFQDFTPTPATLATAMYCAECDINGKKINVPRVSSKNNIEREMFIKK